MDILWEDRNKYYRGTLGRRFSAKNGQNFVFSISYDDGDKLTVNLDDFFWRLLHPGSRILIATYAPGELDKLSERFSSANATCTERVPAPKRVKQQKRLAVRDVINKSARKHSADAQATPDETGFLEHLTHRPSVSFAKVSSSEPVLCEKPPREVESHSELKVPRFPLKLLFKLNKPSSERDYLHRSNKWPETFEKQPLDGNAGQYGSFKAPTLARRVGAKRARSESGENIRTAIEQTNAIDGNECLHAGSVEKEPGLSSTLSVCSVVSEECESARRC